MPLTSIEPQRLYRQIANQLKVLVDGGEFRPGARLPAERDLARQLGVSRPSVREALIALEVEGVVEVRTGSGVYVLERKAGRAKASQTVDASEWGPLELIRARRVVEGEVAALAAQASRSAARAPLVAMQEAIDTMKADADQHVLPLDGDRAFHSALVACVDNVVLAETVQRFWDSRLSPLFARLGGHFETVRSWRAAITEHEAIYAAVRARDAPAARAAMHAHMDKSHSRFSASWRRANQVA